MKKRILGSLLLCGVSGGLWFALDRFFLEPLSKTTLLATLTVESFIITLVISLSILLAIVPLVMGLKLILDIIFVKE